MPEIKKKGRIAGIDYGLVRIGISISDEMKIIATPCKTITAEKKLEQTVSKIILELDQLQKEKNFVLEEIVVGLPLLLSGKVGLQADEVKVFVEMLRKVSSVPVVVWDERLTSVQADRAMREGNMTRKKRSKLVDSVAAVILLQSYLDSKNLNR